MKREVPQTYSTCGEYPLNMTFSYQTAKHVAQYKLHVASRNTPSNTPSFGACCAMRDFAGSVALAQDCTQASGDIHSRVLDFNFLQNGSGAKAVEIRQIELEAKRARARSILITVQNYFFPPRKVVGTSYIPRLAFGSKNG